MKECLNIIGFLILIVELGLIIKFILDRKILKKDKEKYVIVLRWLESKKEYTIIRTISLISIALIVPVLISFLIYLFLFTLLVVGVIFTFGAMNIDKYVDVLKNYLNVSLTISGILLFVIPILTLIRMHIKNKLIKLKFMELENEKE